MKLCTGNCTCIFGLFPPCPLEKKVHYSFNNNDSKPALHSGSGLSQVNFPKHFRPRVRIIHFRFEIDFTMQFKFELLYTFQKLIVKSFYNN